MEIFKLDSSFKPSSTLKEFKSFIWAERYKEPGDFEITTEDDISIVSLFPLGTLISHTNTHEVMIVENYEITRTKEKKLEVKVTGRSFETFAENRNNYGCDNALEDGSGNQNVQTTTSMSSSSAAEYVLKRKLEPGTASTDDEITNLLVVDLVTNHDAPMVYALKRGSLYSQVLEFLEIGNYGIKTVRPNGTQTTMNLIIHDGASLTSSVIFYAQSEDLEDAKYFKSIKTYKNYARISAKVATRLYRHRDLATDFTSLNRRVLYVEASDLEGAYSPPTSSDALASRAQAALDENKKISIVQAKISITAKPKFKLDYDVGDVVKVFGEFDTAENMRVTEHILTVDSDGMRGYPALSAL